MYKKRKMEKTKKTMKKLLLLLRNLAKNKRYNISSALYFHEEKDFFKANIKNINIKNRENVLVMTIE